MTWKSSTLTLFWGIFLTIIFGDYFFRRPFSVLPIFSQSSKLSFFALLIWNGFLFLKNKIIKNKKKLSWIWLIMMTGATLANIHTPCPTYVATSGDHFVNSIYVMREIPFCRFRYLLKTISFFDNSFDQFI